ncbi:class I SAM-dependent methyltransferase [Zavarzinia sp. CC-PAN008]|uniref:class I SAM-dependent methyltransferase n=1 Tax=Zavarzinia sp. CC-PAN008 TaxID=3243332 RepID=UPI003F749516
MSSLEAAPQSAKRRRSLLQRIAIGWAERAEKGSLTLVFADGTQHVFATATQGPDAVIRLHRDAAVWRVLTGGELGLAEAFMDGDWSTPDLYQVLAFGYANEHVLAGALRASPLVGVASRLWHRLHANTRAGARRNIAHHYDLGNAFYALWLDRSMTYSAAVFAAPDEALEAAQARKYDRIIQHLGIRPGDRVLEIGCGWGGFAERAARAGARVTGLTLSREQAEFARRRMAEAGVGDQVEIALTDYRDVAGTFDHVVSIEMFEAVGEANWPTYFNVVRERLRPGGRAMLQVITVDDGRFATYRRQVDFIQRYIFPGGMLPSPRALEGAVTRAGLRLAQQHWFGIDYAETLDRWHHAFQAQWERIAPLGFDERFRRMWAYYLKGCEAAFRAQATDVGQFLIERPAS